MHRIDYTFELIDKEIKGCKAIIDGIDKDLKQLMNSLDNHEHHMAFLDLVLFQSQLIDRIFELQQIWTKLFPFKMRHEQFAKAVKICTSFL